MKTYHVLWRIFKENKLFGKVDTVGLQKVASDAQSDKWNVVADEARPRLKEVLDNAAQLKFTMSDTYIIPFNSAGMRADSAAIEDAIKDTADNMPLHDAAVIEQIEKARYSELNKNGIKLSETSSLGPLPKKKTPRNKKNK